MSTLRFALRTVIFTGALLAAPAALASDVTPDSHQAAPQQTSPATVQNASSRPLDRAMPEASASHSCTCSHSGPSSKSLSPAEEEELNQLRRQNG